MILVLNLIYLISGSDSEKCVWEKRFWDEAWVFFYVESIKDSLPHIDNLMSYSET